MDVSLEAPTLFCQRDMPERPLMGKGGKEKAKLGQLGYTSDKYNMPRLVLLP